MEGQLWTALQQNNLNRFHDIVRANFRMLDEFLLSYAVESSRVIAAIHQDSESIAENQHRQKARQLSIIDVNAQDQNGYSLLHHIAFSRAPNAVCFAYILLSIPQLHILTKCREHQLTAFHLALGIRNLGVAHAIYKREQRETAKVHPYSSFASQRGASDDGVRSKGSLADAESYLGLTPFELPDFSRTRPNTPVGLKALLKTDCSFDSLDEHTQLQIEKEFIGRENAADQFNFYSFPDSVTLSEGRRRGTDEADRFGSMLLGQGNNKNFTLGLKDNDFGTKTQVIPVIRSKAGLPRLAPRPLSSIIQNFKPGRNADEHGPLSYMCSDDRMEASRQNLIESEEPGVTRRSSISAPAPANYDAAHPNPYLVKNKTLQISSVHVSNFHSAVLTDDARSNLYLCGHGQGGRLGFSDQLTKIHFTCIDSGELSRYKVSQVALGNNHTLALTTGGSLYSWGSNEYGQTGHKPAKDSPNGSIQPTPLLLNHGKIRGASISHILASPVHSVVVSNKREVFVFGKNDGQLGIPKISSDASQSTPYLLSTHMFGDESIESISTSECATAVVLGNNRTWVFSNYNYRSAILVQGKKSSKGRPFEPTAASEQALAPLRPVGLKVGAIVVKQRHIVFLNTDGSIYYYEVLETDFSHESYAPINFQQIYMPKVWERVPYSVDVGENGDIYFSTNSGSLWKISSSSIRAKAKSATSGASAPLLVPMPEPVSKVSVNSVGSIIALSKAEDFASLDIGKYNDSYGLYRALDVPVVPPIQETASGSLNDRLKDYSARLSVPGLSFYLDLWWLFPLRELVTGGNKGGAVSYSLGSRWGISHSGFLRERLEFCHLLCDVAVGKGELIFEKLSKLECSNIISPEQLIVLCSRESGIKVPVHRSLFSIRFPKIFEMYQRMEEGAEDSMQSSQMVSIRRNGSLEGGTIEVDLSISVAEMLRLVFYIYTEITSLEAAQWVPDESSGVTPNEQRLAIFELDSRFRDILGVLDVPLEASLAQLPLLCVELQDLWQGSVLDVGGSGVEGQLPRRYLSVFANCDTGVLLEGGKCVVPIHSDITTARCAVLGRMILYSTGNSLGGSELVSIQGFSRLLDFRESSALAFTIVRHHIYSGCTGPSLFANVTAADQQTFLELVLEVTLLADELLLDSLSHGCQRVLLSSVTWKNVGWMFNVLDHVVVDTFRLGAAQYAGSRVGSLLRYGDVSDLIPLFDFVRARAGSLAMIPAGSSGNEKEGGTRSGDRYRAYYATSVTGKPIMLELCRPDTGEALAAIAAQGQKNVGKGKEPILAVMTEGMPNKKEPLVVGEGLVVESLSDPSPVKVDDNVVTTDEALAAEGMAGTSQSVGQEGDYTLSGSGSQGLTLKEGARAALRPSMNDTSRRVSTGSAKGVSGPPLTFGSRSLSNGAILRESVGGISSQSPGGRNTNSSETPGVVDSPKQASKAKVLDMRASYFEQELLRKEEARVAPVLEPPRYVSFSLVRLNEDKKKDRDRDRDRDVEKRVVKTVSMAEDGPKSSLWSAVSSLETEEDQKQAKGKMSAKAAPGKPDGPRIILGSSSEPAGAPLAAVAVPTRVNPLLNTKLEDTWQNESKTSKPVVFSVQHQPPPRAQLYFSPLVDPSVGTAAATAMAEKGAAGRSTRKTRRAAGSKMPTPSMQDILAEEEFGRWWEAEERRRQEEEDASLAMALALAGDDGEGVEGPGRTGGAGGTGKRRGKGRGGGGGRSASGVGGDRQGPGGSDGGGKTSSQNEGSKTKPSGAEKKHPAGTSLRPASESKTNRRASDRRTADRRKPNGQREAGLALPSRPDPVAVEAGGSGN